MVNKESIVETGHFIMLDLQNTESENEFDRSNPIVQIISPSDKNSYIENQSAESHSENGLTHKERRKYLYAISLNLNMEY